MDVDKDESEGIIDAKYLSGSQLDSSIDRNSDALPVVKIPYGDVSVLSQPHLCNISTML